MDKLSAKGRKTRDKIVTMAADLFHQQGVAATSVDQVLTQSGTGKSQFYHYFASKDDLVLAVLRYRLEGIRAHQGRISYAVHHWDDIAALFDTHARVIRDIHGYRRSCPIGSLTAELAGINEDYRRLTAQLFDAMKANFVTFFHQMKAQGALAETADPESLADFCLAVLQGATLMLKAYKSTAPLDNAAAHAMAYLETFRT